MSDSILIFGLAVVGLGLYAVLRSATLARRNREHAVSGDEAYFEERRSWKHYSSMRPSTDPAAIARFGWIQIGLGVVFALASQLPVFRSE